MNIFDIFPIFFQIKLIFTSILFCRTILFHCNLQNKSCVITSKRLIWKLLLFLHSLRLRFRLDHKIPLSPLRLRPCPLYYPGHAPPSADLLLPPNWAFQCGCQVFFVYSGTRLLCILWLWCNQLQNFDLLWYKKKLKFWDPLQMWSPDSISSFSSVPFVCNRTGMMLASLPEGWMLKSVSA